MGDGVRTLSWLDTLRFQLHVGVASIAMGVVVPRRRSLARAAKRGRDIAAIRLLRDLRAAHGGHFWTRFPVRRRTLLVVDPETIDQILRSTANSPDPPIKTWPVSRFIPDALVVSGNAAADEGRRNFNTAALDLDAPIRHAETFADIAVAEVERMTANRSGSLRWRDFQSLGTRVSQQVIMGAGQTEPELERHLARMTRFSNWFVRHPCSFAAFYDRVDALLHREPVASKACLMHGAASGVGAKPSTRVASQVGFWFFVLKDVVELHVSRTLALIAAHPEVQAKVRQEVRGAGPLNAAAIEGMHYLGACIAEGLRLWTPVPLLLRRADRDFVLPDGTAIDREEQLLIHAAFYHRDPDVFKDRADAFLPDAAIGATQATYVFSAHGRGCAGRTLAMFVLKAALASLLARFRFELAGPGIEPGRIAYHYDHYCIDLLPVPDA